MSAADFFDLYGVIAVEFGRSLAWNDNGDVLLLFQCSRFTTAVPCCYSSAPGSQRRCPVVIPALPIHNGSSLLLFQCPRFTTAIHRCHSSAPGLQRQFTVVNQLHIAVYITYFCPASTDALKKNILKMVKTNPSPYVNIPKSCKSITNVANNTITPSRHTNPNNLIQFISP